MPSHEWNINGSKELNVLLVYLKPKWSKLLKVFAKIQEFKLEVDG